MRGSCNLFTHARTARSTSFHSGAQYSYNPLRYPVLAWLAGWMKSDASNPVKQPLAVSGSFVPVPPPAPPSPPPGSWAPCIGEFTPCADGSCTMSASDCGKCSSGQYLCPSDQTTCVNGPQGYASCPGMAGTHFDMSLPIEKRLDYLVAHTNLTDQIAQLTNNAPAIPYMGIPSYNWLNDDQHGVARTSAHATVLPNGCAPSQRRLFAPLDAWSDR